jgi:hypothetical protein
MPALVVRAALKKQAGAATEVDWRSATLKSLWTPPRSSEPAPGTAAKNLPPDSPAHPASPGSAPAPGSPPSASRQRVCETGTSKDADSH